MSNNHQKPLRYIEPSEITITELWNCFPEVNTSKEYPQHLTASWPHENPSDGPNFTVPCPPRMRLRFEDCQVTSAIPTHVLACLEINESGTGESTFLRMYPTHGSLLARSCRIFRRIDSRKVIRLKGGFKGGEKNMWMGALTVPVVPLLVPYPDAFPFLHEYFYTRDRKALQRRLLPDGWKTNATCVLRCMSRISRVRANAHALDAKGSRMYTLLDYAYIATLATLINLYKDRRLYTPHPDTFILVIEYLLKRDPAFLRAMLLAEGWNKTDTSAQRCAALLEDVWENALSLGIVDGPMRMQEGMDMAVVLEEARREIRSFELTCRRLPVEVPLVTIRHADDDLPYESEPDLDPFAAQ